MLFIFFLSNLFLLILGRPLSGRVGSCSTSCERDLDCLRDSLSPCSFCSNNVCISLCGIGCRSSSDCQNGGTNPCLYCSPATRTCVNPNPLCGSYCPNNVACLANGTKPTRCSQCDMNTNSCNTNSSSLCGKVCGGQFQCSSDPKCSQCIGFFCAPPQSCGQVCIGSGQCQMNPGRCKACIGAVCENLRPCGGACGGDDWCGPSCPICGFAKCVNRREYERQKQLRNSSSVADDELSSVSRDRKDHV